jgi:succinyl-CoA synthetase alpha subunit
MGHAGAWTGLAEGTAESKHKALEAVGVTMVDHPAKFGGVMKDIMAKAGRNSGTVVSLPSIFELNHHLTKPRTNLQPKAPNAVPTIHSAVRNLLPIRAPNHPSRSALYT